MSIKALAARVLQGNLQGNPMETMSFSSPKRGELKSFQVSQYIDRNRETVLDYMVGESLAEVDRLGRPWPSRFLLDMPAADQGRLREIEAAIDAAVIGGSREKLDDLLAEWRELLLNRLN